MLTEIKAGASAHSWQHYTVLHLQAPALPDVVDLRTSGGFSTRSSVELSTGNRQHGCHTSNHWCVFHYLI
jgi:hypothetical protein